MGAACTGALMLLPATAGAASVTKDGGLIRVIDHGASADELSVGYGANLTMHPTKTISITQVAPGTLTTSDPECVVDNQGIFTAAYCEGAGVTRIIVKTGGGRDSAQIGGSIPALPDAISALMIGGAGKDRLFGDAPAGNVLVGGAGADTLGQGTSGSSRTRQVMKGGRGNDYLSGWRGKDSYRGGRGRDWIDATAPGGDPDLLISCGRRRDKAEVDNADPPTRRCERVIAGP